MFLKDQTIQKNTDHYQKEECDQQKRENHLLLYKALLSTNSWNNSGARNTESALKAQAAGESSHVWKVSAKKTQPIEAGWEGQAKAPWHSM